MAKDNQILVRVNDPTDEAIESFAEKHDYTKAEAVRRMVEDRLAGEGHMGDNRAVPDGGQILNRIEAVEKSQQNRLDEIDRKVEASLEDESSWLSEWLETMRISAAGLTLGGVVAYILSAAGQLSLSPSLAFWFIGINTAFLLTFLFIQEVIE